MREFWFLEDDKQLAFQEKELEKVITRQTDVVVSITTKNNVRGYKRLDIDDDNQSILPSLEKDKLLILFKPRSPPMTGSFPYKDNLDYHLTPRFQAQKFKKRALTPPLSDRETRSITASSNPCF